MNGATVLTKFTADTKDFDSKTKSVNNSINSIAKDIVVATGITKAISAAWNMVSNSLDDAILRYDIMNNFPKVMKNLGISTDEAQQSIDLMSEKLMGLPTTLNEGALAVQRFTSANGDIKKSTDLFLAVNNAILAGGAPTANQAAALEQLSQAYAKGKPDMMEWRTLMTAMPAQLKQVANAMGYVSAAELGEAVRTKEGTAEFERMMDTIIELNEVGTAEFGTFEEQARNATNGIQTALKNMHSRTVQGVTAMIDAIDEGLAKADMGNIASIMEGIGNFFRDNLKKLAPYITTLIVNLGKIGNWITKNRAWLEAIIVPLTTFIATFMGIMKIISIIKSITTAISLLNAVMLANPIVLIIAGIVALIAALVYLWNNCEAFREFFVSLWEGIKSVVAGVIEWFSTLPETIGEFVNNIITFLSNLPYYVGYMIGFIIGKLVLFITETVPNFIKNLIEWFGSLPEKIRAIINNLINIIGNWFVKIWQDAKVKVPQFINNIINWFKEMPSKLLNIGKNIVEGLWKGIKNATGWIKKKVGEFAKGILDGIKKSLGIASPSKEFAIVGKFCVLGYTEALDDMQKDVQQQVNKTFGISPQLASSSALSYTPNVIVNNNINMKQDPLGQMVNDIKTFSGGSKNDYNYGMGV